MKVLKGWCTTGGTTSASWRPSWVRWFLPFSLLLRRSKAPEISMPLHYWLGPFFIHATALSSSFQLRYFASNKSASMNLGWDISIFADFRYNSSACFLSGIGKFSPCGHNTYFILGLGFLIKQFNPVRHLLHPFQRLNFASSNIMLPTWMFLQDPFRQQIFPTRIQHF